MDSIQIHFYINLKCQYLILCIALIVIVTCPRSPLPPMHTTNDYIVPVQVDIHKATLNGNRNDTEPDEKVQEIFRNKFDLSLHFVLRAPQP